MVPKTTSQQKIGSTTLHGILAAHSGVQGCKTKELNFYVRNGYGPRVEQWDTVQNISTYASKCPTVESLAENYIVDGSVSLIYRIAGLLLLNHTVPNAKVIIVVKRPDRFLFTQYKLYNDKCTKLKAHGELANEPLCQFLRDTVTTPISCHNFQNFMDYVAEQAAPITSSCETEWTAECTRRVLSLSGNVFVKGLYVYFIKMGEQTTCVGLRSYSFVVVIVSASLSACLYTRAQF
jgi:hypothetical protein